jgi:hypothetical protein
LIEIQFAFHPSFFASVLLFALRMKSSYVAVVISLCHLSSRFPDRNIKIKNGTENRLQGESEEGPGQEDKEAEGAQLSWSACCQGEAKLD